jgi:hypothetical protein
MKQDTYKTVTIIRKWGDDYIAIFPHELGIHTPYTCQSYMTIGQHGSCDPQGIIEQSEPTNTPERQTAKYRDFVAELESIGYNLDIRQRIPYNSLDIRRKKLAEFYS